MATLEVDQHEALVRFHQEVIGQRVVLINPRVMQSAQESAEAFRQQPALFGGRGWIREDRAQIPCVELGDDRKAAPEQSEVSFLSHRDGQR